ncbi:MAG TPA: hypothetical protein ENG75_03405 [Nitrospirae bacterium]|nr:hypothetical protein [Nitrospirota bacterium]
MKQLDSEWFEARRGLVTGSRVGRIVDGGERSWNTLLKELKREQTMTGQDFLDNQINAAPLRHGNKYEPIALANYEMVTGIDVDRPAFITNSAYPGCSYSPDGLWPRMERLIEIKAPYNPDVHSSTVMYGTGAKTYRAQCQFGMALTETNLCDFISFDKRYADPSKRLFIITVERDEPYIEKMLVKIHRFLEMLDSGTEREVQSNKIPELF